MKMFLTVLKLQRGHDFHSKIFKGALFRKNADEITVLFLYTASDGRLVLYKV